MIYISGVKADELVAIIDFLYFGEANVNQESLDSFLALAEELKLRGLTGSSEFNDDKYTTKAPPENKVPQKKQYVEPALNLPNPLKIYNPNAKIESSSMTPVTLVSTDVQQLDEEVKSMMGTSENMLTVGNSKQRARICKVCGKEGTRANILTHIEANHIISNVTHTCDICGKISRSRHGLRLHKTSEHCTGCFF